MSTAPQTSPHDALAFLSANHKALLASFRDYEFHKGRETPAEKGKAALRLCHRLSIHCVLEDEIFHPAAAALGGNVEAAIKQARIQMGVMRGVIDKIAALPAEDAAFDPTVRVLGDDARRHFEAEESALFPLLRHGDFDRAGTGERMATRQAELSTAPVGKAVIDEARRVLGG